MRIDNVGWTSWLYVTLFMIFLLSKGQWATIHPNKFKALAIEMLNGSTSLIIIKYCLLLA